jgi:WD40 repeat protein
MGALRAVKIIWRRQFESQRPYDREFAGIQRYEPVSRSSSGLVHVLHVGRNDEEGYFYYVMELADDAEWKEFGGGQEVPSRHSRTPVHDRSDSYSARTLRSDIKRLGRLPTADCVRVGLEVVGGLAELQRHGLVHRDVKPGNIIYVNGRAKLADLGLVSTGGEGRTFVGTEGYVPPEGPGSTGADLYALGIALYEASTGNAPEKFPDVPTEWMISDANNGALEFHEIILKACEGQRERRYESAEAMQADLALLQSGQSLRRVRALERRYARLRVSGIVGAILLACAVAAVFFANYRARVAAESRAKERRLREQAQSAQTRAEGAEREARQQLYTALLGEARAVVHSGELGQRVKALDALRRAAAISNNVELRREVFAALALSDLRFDRELPLGPNVTGAQCDPAFERVAICRGRRAVEIRAVSDNRLLVSLPARADLMSYLVRWSSDGRYLAVKRDADSGSRLNVLEVWEVATSRRVLELEDLSREAVSFHPQRPWLIVGQPGAVSIRDLESGQELRRFVFTNHTIRLVEFSPTGENLAVLQAGPTQHVVTVSSTLNGLAALSRNFSEQITALAWQPDGKSIALTDRAGRVQLLDAQTGETRLLGRHKLEAVTLAFSPDGRYLLSGGWERELICWDMRTRQRAFLVGLDSYHLQFSAAGRRCAILTRAASGPLFQKLSLHDFEQPVAHREFAEDLGARLDTAAFSPDGRWLAASAFERAGVWDLSAPGPGALDESGHEMRLGFNTDGSEMFGGRYKDRGAACLRWRLKPAANSTAPPGLTRLPLHKPDGFNFLAVRSNSIVMTCDRGSQLLGPEEFEIGSDRWVSTSPGLNGVSPDGRWLAIFQPWREILYVYRLPELEAVATLRTRSSIGDFKFSPVGDELAVWTRDGVDFWSTATWQQTRAVTNMSRLLYTRDGRTLWLSKDLRTGGLHDARDLELLLPLPPGTLPLALSPDGRHLAVSVDLRRLQLWDLAELRKQLAQLGLDWPEHASNARAVDQ